VSIDLLDRTLLPLGSGGVVIAAAYLTPVTFKKALRVCKEFVSPLRCGEANDELPFLRLPLSLSCSAPPNLRKWTAS
jgi:hypothetical protein